MPDKPSNTTASAHQIELAIRRLDSLSTLPSIAARFFSKLLEPQFSASAIFSPSAIADIIESDPALTAKILSLIHQQGVSLPDEKFSLRGALDKLPAQLVRDTVLSVKVFRTFDHDNSRILLRTGLIQHALAVACCAKDIAEIISPQMDSQLAYSAGLLHDIGKLALEEAMPKSLARIFEEAQSTKASACAIEQQNLGTDHTILGKRLAQKWHLPNPITLAIWLHHNDTGPISQNMSEARIAQVVQLADSVARESGIGQSGSFDSPEPTEKIAQSLAITPKQLGQIRRKLPETVGQKSKVVGLDLPNAVASYCDAAHTAAAQLAQEQTKLSLENSQLQTASSHLDFTTEFLLSINSSTPAIDIAENFAVRWQKFYQTGMVCVYLVPPAGQQFLEAIVVENLAQTKTVILNAPVRTPVIPEAIANSFAILDAHDYIDWLFEQLDIEFDLKQTKLAPLPARGKAVGGIAFELRYPGDAELFEDKFKTATSIVGAVLDMAFTSANQQRFAEQFAQLLAKPKEAQPRIAAESSLNALAEMAAGAAHELNNPLSVISGRAQLLDKAEIDPEKKRILKQIQENTGEISAIIEDLMSFANPPEPRPAETNIKQMLDEAVQLTSQKTGVEHINVQIEVTEDVKSVFVDSAQIVSAIANILSNAIESYTGSLGPVKVTATAEGGNFVKLQINDLGCGMDAETLQKATQPLFSAKPAGRKRGMGLAHAARLIQLNKGSLEITSEPDKGTTVTIYLLCK
ncbi:MAG: HDOD domain-containing protein [Planctomycetota bacterium]|jgi:putative nucleotidyltransferase with HDIG domain